MAVARQVITWLGTAALTYILIVLTPGFMAGAVSYKAYTVVAILVALGWGIIAPEHLTLIIKAWKTRRRNGNNSSGLSDPPAP